VLIPARNEAESIRNTLSCLAAQGRGHRIILIDDQSDDGTAELAHSLNLTNLQIIQGHALPDGWSGKLWALEQGMSSTDSAKLLLLDADIELRPGILHELNQLMDRQQLDLASLMVSLRMVSRWEKLLMPAFVFFFKLLYPFRLSNSTSPWVAAAAGGCILIKRERLEQTGGFAALKSALIDDCTLARQIKKAGGRTWLGLSRSAISTRRYEDLASIWHMVSRTAYTQLHYSVSLLVLCTLLMYMAFVTPVSGLLGQTLSSQLLAGGACVCMLASYQPVLRYYALSPLWALLMPLTGILFLLMTWSSALRYWRGTRSVWKGRNY
jgi:hopene-associated glycosyltransferase HpnB